MDWFSQNVDGTDIGVIITAITAVCIAFINVRRRGDGDKISSTEPTTVVQGQPVQLEASTPFESYLIKRSRHLEKKVDTLEAHKDILIEALHEAGVPVPKLE